MPALYDAAIRVVGGLFILFALILASRWLTELTAPRPVAKLPTMSAAPTENNLKSLGKLFGVNVAQSQSLDGVQLAGVFAGSNGGGFATFQTRSGPIAVFPGDEVAPGIRLKKIERDHVIVLGGGIPRELRLRENNAGSDSPIGRPSMIRPQPLSAYTPPGVEPGPQVSASSAAKPKEEEQ